MLDSVQGRGPCLAFLPFVSNPELEGCIVTWDFMETIHSRSYTYIIKNLYAEKNKTILDEMVEDITQSNGYAEFIRHRSSKLYYIQECNKLLNIEHSNVEVETISIEDIKK